MTVQTTTRKQQFVLNGSTAAFTFTFRALPSAPSDVKCIATSGAGVDTDLVYTTQFTVSVNSNGVGGTVTLVSPSALGSGTLTVYRDTTNTQASDYDDFNQFPANTLENDLDIRTLISQEQKETLGRTLTLSISSDSGVSAMLPSPSAGTVLGWNDDEDEIENKTLSDLSATSLASQAQAQAGTDNTTYMSPLRTASAITSLTATNTSNSITEIAVPGTDQTASGIKVLLNAAENLAFGEVGYINGNGVVNRSNAGGIGTASSIVMALGAVTIASSSSGTLLLQGLVRNDAWNWTPGGLIYLSTTTGSVTQTAPTGTNQVIQILGVATHADRMFFNPQLVQVEHT